MTSPTAGWPYSRSDLPRAPLAGSPAAGPLWNSPEAHRPPPTKRPLPFLLRRLPPPVPRWYREQSILKQLTFPMKRRQFVTPPAPLHLAGRSQQTRQRSELEGQNSPMRFKSHWPPFPARCRPGSSKIRLKVSQWASKSGICIAPSSCSKRVFQIVNFRFLCCSPLWRQNLRHVKSWL